MKPMTIAQYIALILTIKGVLLETHDGLTMHITRANNYLVEVTE